MDTYNKINHNSIKGLILINIRDEHIKKISLRLLELNMIPLEYIKDKIRLDNISKNNNNTLDISNDNISEYLINILSKECIKHTAKYISDMCKN